jgi:hypothetical protein
MLRTSRSLYLITGIGTPGECDAAGGARVTMHIERVPNAMQRHPLAGAIHPFRWDARGKRAR